MIKVARMTARAPIVNINQDLRFVAAAGPTLKQREEMGGELPWISCNGGIRYSRIESAWMCSGTRIFLLVEDGLKCCQLNPIPL